MQAFAKNITADMENPVGSNNESFETIDNPTSLFSADEIIFPNENSTHIFSRYGYKISNMNFLVPEQTVSEVIQNPDIYSLPNSPSWIEGLINIRGNIIPVMNIEKWLKITNEISYSNILLLDKSDNNSAIAILISELPISLELNDSKTSISNYPEKIHEYINSGFTQNSLDWIEFNPQELFKKLADK